MIDLIRRTLMIGVGAVSLTRDRIEQFVNDSVARGELTTEQGKSLLDEMTERADQQQQRLESFVRQYVNRALEAAGLATREELRRVEAQVTRLETRLRDLAARTVSSQYEDSVSTPEDGILRGPGTAPITVEPPSDEVS